MRADAVAVAQAVRTAPFGRLHRSMFLAELQPKSINFILWFAALFWMKEAIDASTIQFTDRWQIQGFAMPFVFQVPLDTVAV